jgi:hypothetical protein
VLDSGAPRSLCFADGRWSGREYGTNASRGKRLFLLLLVAGVMVAVNNGGSSPGAGIAIAGVAFYVISRVRK